MRNTLLLGVAAAALVAPAAAMAQSTGTISQENDIVVTGTRTTDVDGYKVPETPKAKAVLTQEAISRSAPGQSIDSIINQLPSVSFQNNDPFGSAGGTLNIRGFDSSRISQTFDGIPLNDTGNYAIYSNQQLDPELIEQVNVNFGTTDVDAPTAAASGSTVNYRTIDPTEQFGARLEGSVGDDNFFRVFGIVNTGNLTSFGTRAFVSASHAENNWFVNDFGRIDKAQYNAKIYQPIGSNGDFISIAGNYNVNRNNFGGSVPLRTDTTILNASGAVTGARTVGTGTNNRFPNGFGELPYHIARCQTDTPQAGIADTPAVVSDATAANNGSQCGTSFDERYNPSNTGNIRINSKFTLANGVVLTVDPSFQYVKANGGGTVTGREGAYKTKAGATLYGFVGGNYYFGRDLNGDGDALDQVTLLAPSQTGTHRYGVIASLRYDFAKDQSFRLGYSHDYGRHRQTGEVGFLQANGVPFDVFPINNGITAVNGRLVEKRDRLSFAILDQVSGEYVGSFLDHHLTVSGGVRAPFFKRDLNNFCFTTSATGFVDCLGRGNDTDNATYAAANPYSYNDANSTVTGYAPPGHRVLKYNRVLPEAGLTYRFDSPFSVYLSYSKGLQVPGTDNLYNSFYYPTNTDQAHPKPETTDNFDAGVRYTTSRIQAQVGPWYTRFTNRLAAAYDPISDRTVYRNLGRVDKYGVDGSIAYRPVRPLLVYAFGSYLKSDIKNDVSLGTCAGNAAGAQTTTNCTPGDTIYAMTAGKRESGAPVYTLGGRLQLDLGPVELGGTFKRTGRRYLNDQNLPAYGCTASLVNQVCPTTSNTTAAYTGTKGVQYQVYGPYAPGYNQVDFDARVGMAWAGLNDKTYLQFNLLNAFNNYYVGGFSGGSTTVYTIPFAQVAYPRTFIATLNVQF